MWAWQVCGHGGYMYVLGHGDNGFNLLVHEHVGLILFLYSKGVKVSSVANVLRS